MKVFREIKSLTDTDEFYPDTDDGLQTALWIQDNKKEAIFLENLSKEHPEGISFQALNDLLSKNEKHAYKLAGIPPYVPDAQGNRHPAY